MPTRWTVEISIGWHPILTFDRRRLELLDWVEDHVHYTGFTDKPDVIGLAVGSMACRAEFRRQGLTLNLSGRDRDMADLMQIVEGALTVLEPKHPKILYVMSAWAEPLEGSYEDLCRRFASQMSMGLDANEFWPADASSLVDFVTPQAQLQCEFGIVTKDELASRLERPGVSRLRTKSQSPAALLDAGELPDVSVYGGISWVPFDVVTINDSGDIQATAVRALDESGRLLTSLASSFSHEFGGTS